MAPAFFGNYRSFTSLKSGHPSKDKQLLLTAILADGINLGLTKMGRIIHRGTDKEGEPPAKDVSAHAARTDPAGPGRVAV